MTHVRYLIINVIFERRVHIEDEYPACVITDGRKKCRSNLSVGAYIWLLHISSLYHNASQFCTPDSCFGDIRSLCGIHYRVGFTGMCGWMLLLNRRKGNDPGYRVWGTMPLLTVSGRFEGLCPEGL